MSKHRPVVCALVAASLLATGATAGAQEAAPAAEPASAIAAGGTWPRLFFTPEERRRVTQQRQVALDSGRRVATGAPVDDGAVLAADAPRSAPRVDGISLVRGARFAAWIGGRRVEDGGRWDGYRLRVTRDGVQFIDATGTARLVKVGQPVSMSARTPGRAAP